MSELETQLEEVLGKEPSSLIEAQKTAFEKLTAQTAERFVLFGAGRLGQITLAGLRKAGIEPLAFADNNRRIWDTRIEGLQVFSPRLAAEQFGKTAVFIITIYTSAPVWKQLTDMRLKVTSFAALAWQYPQFLTPHGGVEIPERIFRHSNEVREAFHLWADDASRREYIGQLEWRTTLDSSVLPSHLPQNEIYFANDLFTPLAEEVFVDCGAFDGDSMQEFIKRQANSFSQIIAIEPDSVNCGALRTRIASFPDEIKNKIKVVQSAVGSKHAMVPFNTTGTAGSSIGKGSHQIECAPLDDLLYGIRPTYIKMDIEGAEPEALLGASKIIRQDAPTLAVCLYHMQEHLWQIPLLIHSLNNQYDFFLRRYADDCWELVCYAVPKNRFIARPTKERHP